MALSDEDREEIRNAALAGGMGHEDLDALEIGLCTLEGCIGEYDNKDIAAVRRLMDGVRDGLVDEDDE